MKYFYDTEFLEDGKTINLISIGIVAEDGRTYYAVNSNMEAARIQTHTWLRENVWPHLPHAKDTRRPEWQPLDYDNVVVKPKKVIANEVREFLLRPPGFKLDKVHKVELWGYYPAYDHVALMQLWGPMSDAPRGIPYKTKDIGDLADSWGMDLIKQMTPEHHALNDAYWTRDAYWDIMNRTHGDKV